MIAIYKREVKSYFETMIGNVFLAFLIAFVGIYFLAYNLSYGYNYFAYSLTSGLLILIVVVPILTMKSFAEERRNKTDQLLLTSPLSLAKIIWGKYLAMISILGVACLIFCICPLIIKSFGSAHLAVDYIAILIFYLIGCVYIAIGMFISSMTESQIIAAIGTMGVLLLLYFWSNITSFLPTAALYNLIAVLVFFLVISLLLYSYLKSWLFAGGFFFFSAVIAMIVYIEKATLFESLLTNTLGVLDLSSILSNLANNNILDLSSIILLMSLAGLFNFLTMQALQKRRWS